MKKTTNSKLRLLFTVSMVMSIITVFAQTNNPSFTSGPNVLCAGTGSCYQATAGGNTIIRYSILSGGASIDAVTGCVTDVTSSFVIRATATDPRGGNPASTDFQVTVPVLLPPPAPPAQWVFGNNAHPFAFNNVTAGTGGNQIEWSTNGNFANSQVAASPATINTTVNAYSTNVLFIRTRDAASGCVSEPTTSLARVVVEPNAPASTNVDATNNIAHCGADVYRQAIYRDDPATYRSMIDLDNQIIQKVALDQAMGRPKSQSEYVIPVVVHVITEQGSGPGISYAQIESQINAMNAAFAADYSGYYGGTASNDASAVNTTIRFCLARNTYPNTILWTNASEPGVMRASTSDNNILSPSANSLSGSAALTAFTGYPTNFPPSMYFNIWVVPHIVMAGLQGAEVLGFATFPNLTSSGSYSSYVDGMVIQAKVFGDNSFGSGYPLMAGEDQGKVAVHEAGHYLATYHVFEPNGVGATSGFCASANTPGCNNDGDLCCDTRPCDIRFGICDNANNCPTPGGTDYPIANFMNYLNQGCVSAFTNDQWQNRMLPSLDLTTSNRNNLWQLTNLDNTGVACRSCVLTAAINYQFTGTCPGAGNPVDFSTPTGTYYCADSWSWTFTGGTPSTSTIANPTVVFPAAGDYPVRLIACESVNGTCDTVDSIIHVNAGAFEANITPLNTTVCSGNSVQIEINITNQVGAYPDVIVLSNGDVVTTYYAYTTWVLQNLTSSQTITIVSINGNTCPASFTGQAEINVIQCCVSNLITNGDFEAGNDGSFTCPNLNYNATSAQGCGDYNVCVPNVGTTHWHPLPGLQDIGNSLTIDGDGPQGTPVDTIIWQQTNIPIVPCSDYTFAFDATDAIIPNTTPIIVSFEIVDAGGVVLNPGQTYTLPLVPNFTGPPPATGPAYNFYWSQATFNWNSGATPAGNYTLRIQQITNFSCSGADYSLDNITFSRVVGSCAGPPLGESFNICQGNCVTLGNTIPATGVVTWTPTIGLDNPNIVNPSACPLVSNIYTASAYLNDATYCGTYTVHDTVNVDDLTVDNTIPHYVVCSLPPAQNIGGVTVTGGVTPYTYQWSPATGLSATNIINPDASAPGLYTLTVTDANNCTAQASANIEMEMALTLTATNTCNDSCNGSIDLTVTSPGNLGPYTYLWSHGATTEDVSNLCMGTYTVTVTDVLGCSGTATIDVGGLTLVMSTPDTLCAGASNGTVSVLASGGVAPYTYLWNDANNTATSSVTGLSAGVYTVTVTDASGCTSSGTTTVTVSDPMTFTTSSTPTGCPGSDLGTATIIVNGGVTPYSYHWSSGDLTATAHNLDQGIYIVTVTDAIGCTMLGLTQVGAFPLQLATSATHVGCDGTLGKAKVTASGGLAPYTYDWSNGGNTDVINNLMPGNYTVDVTDATGCTATATVVVHQSTPIEATVTSQTSTICSGSSHVVQVTVLNGGFPPYTIVFSDGGSIITSSTVSPPFVTTYVAQNITSSEVISITSINGGICPDTLRGADTVNVVQCCACNLVTNGNFEAGNIGFLSPDLNYSPNFTGTGNYNVYSPAVGPINPPHIYDWFSLPGLQDLGNSLVIDGTEPESHAGPPPYSIDWQEDNVHIDPCADYIFKFDVTNAGVGAFSPQPLYLQFEILDAGGNVLNPGQVYTVPMVDLVIRNFYWNEALFNWNSGTTPAGNYTIRITQITNFNMDGADYAIDNISFCKVAGTCSSIAGQSYSVCAPGCVTIGTNIPPNANVMWSPVATLVDPTQNSPTACPPSTTIYTGTVTILDTGALCGTYIVHDTVNVTPRFPIIYIDTTVCDTSRAVVYIPPPLIVVGSGGTFTWTLNGLPYSPDPMFAPNLLLTESGLYMLITSSNGCSDTMIVNAHVDSCGVCTCPVGMHCCTNVSSSMDHVYLSGNLDDNNGPPPTLNFHIQVSYGGPSGSQVIVQLDPSLQGAGTLGGISTNVLNHGDNDISGYFEPNGNGDSIDASLFCLELVVIDSLTGDTCQSPVCGPIPDCRLDLGDAVITCLGDSNGFPMYLINVDGYYGGHNQSSLTIIFTSSIVQMSTNALNNGYNHYTFTVIDTTPIGQDTAIFLINDSLNGSCEVHLPVDFECNDHCGLTLAPSCCTKITCDGIDPASGLPIYNVNIGVTYNGNPGAVLNISSSIGPIPGIPNNIPLPDLPYYLTQASGQFSTSAGSICFTLTVTDSSGTNCSYDTCFVLPVLECYQPCNLLDLQSFTDCAENAAGQQTVNYTVTLSNSGPVFPATLTVLSNLGPATASWTMLPTFMVINGTVVVNQDLDPMTLSFILADGAGGYCAQTISVPNPCDDGNTVAAHKMMDVVPNPANNMVNFRFALDGGTKNSITITDLVGRTLKRFDNIGTEGNIGYDLHMLDEGMYMVVLTKDGLIQDVQRLIVTH